MHQRLCRASTMVDHYVTGNRTLCGIRITDRASHGRRSWFVPRYDGTLCRCCAERR